MNPLGMCYVLVTGTCPFDGKATFLWHSTKSSIHFVSESRLPLFCGPQNSINVPRYYSRLHKKYQQLFMLLGKVDPEDSSFVLSNKIHCFFDFERNSFLFLRQRNNTNGFCCYARVRYKNYLHFIEVLTGLF
jgi:hypothetical protein